MLFQQEIRSVELRVCPMQLFFILNTIYTIYSVTLKQYGSVSISHTYTSDDNTLLKLHKVFHGIEVSAYANYSISIDNKLNTRP